MNVIFKFAHAAMHPNLHQNAENVTHIKGRLLDRAVILLIASFFIMGTSLKGNNLLPEGANSFL